MSISKNQASDANASYGMVGVLADFSIESMFSTVRDAAMNIKRFRGSAMRQRWLGTVLLHCEKGFRKVKGYKEIELAMRMIDAFQQDLKMAA